VAQALIPDKDLSVGAAFERAGFWRLASLQYLKREVRDSDRTLEDGPPGDVELVPWRETDDRELSEALERSYEGTLDCPELCDLRDTSDVIASHRASGHWDPDMWWVVRRDGAPAGAMLFNPAPELGTIELVYLGLAPPLRGVGVGRRLLRWGLGGFVERLERSVTCAVDERNAPARSMYARLGFRAFERRTAYVRALGESAGG